MFRDFYLVSNQFKLWMLTTDIAYLRDSAVKGFETIVQRNKNFLQVRLILLIYVKSKVNESRSLTFRKCLINPTLVTYFQMKSTRIKFKW